MSFSLFLSFSVALAIASGGYIASDAFSLLNARLSLPRALLTILFVLRFWRSRSIDDDNDDDNDTTTTTRDRNVNECYCSLSNRVDGHDAANLIGRTMFLDIHRDDERASSFARAFSDVALSTRRWRGKVRYGKTRRGEVRRDEMT